MHFLRHILLVFSISCCAVGFQPDDFHYWYLQSSIVVDHWLYITGGAVVTDSPTVQHLAYTYSIDLSESWTTTDVQPVTVSVPASVIDIKEPMLWYNQRENEVHMWAGLPFNESTSPGSYSFSPTSSGAVVWAESSVPSTGSGDLDGLWSSAYATSPTAFYSIGGANVVQGDVYPVKGMVTNDFETDTWTNETSVDGFDNRFTFDSRIHYVPNFGDAGLLVALSGRLLPNQSSYSDGDFSLAGFLSVDVYDINSRTWYSQQTTGSVPPQVSDFCSVGLQSDGGGSYEIYMFAGATNNTYDTVNWNDVAYRDIYILSLPAFTWIRADKPSEIRRRAMRCEVVGNSQMVVIGGSFFANDDKKRIDPWPNGMAVLDLVNLEWTDGKYDASAGTYRRPSLVQSLYDQSTTPLWDDPALATIFPFRESLATAPSSGSGVQSTASPSPTSDATASKSDHVGAIVGGVVGGICCLVAAAGIYVCIIRRKKKQALKEQASSFTDKHYEMQRQTLGASEMRGEANLPLYEKSATEQSRRHELGASSAVISELQGDTYPVR